MRPKRSWPLHANAGPHGVDRWLLGSVARIVVLLAEGSVLIVRLMGFTETATDAG